jgi:hypothetical protein
LIIVAILVVVIVMVVLAIPVAAIGVPLVIAPVGRLIASRVVLSESFFTAGPATRRNTTRIVNLWTRRDLSRLRLGVVCCGRTLLRWSGVVTHVCLDIGPQL